ncbi:MAG: copper chaperone PCu(A)C [Pseudomonadota bacterium]
MKNETKPVAKTAAKPLVKRIFLLTGAAIVASAAFIMAPHFMGGHGHHMAMAHDYKVGDLTIDHPVARATPPNGRVAGGYMTIRNAGSTDDLLLGGAAAYAGDVEVHTMTMDGDVMKMRELTDGLPIPAGGEVKLRPGGLHVMFMDLAEPLADGEKREAVLRFRDAGEVTVTFNVERTIEFDDADGMKMDHSGHKH